MRNISFANPSLLWLLIPMLLLITVPHLIAIRRTNRSKSTTASLILHVLIVILATLSLAGMKHTTVMTRTEVLVVVDGSYSASGHTEQVDSEIKNIGSRLPDNSVYGVVCFGRNAVYNTRLGEQFVTTANSGVDDSATDIAGALEFARELFSEDAIKRIVLMSDGRHTSSDGSSELVRVVKALDSEGVYIDAVYLDSNISENDSEVQISGVTLDGSTYLNHEAQADVLIHSARELTVALTLRRDGVEIMKTAPALSAGYNLVTLTLPTDEAGDFTYTVSVSSGSDSSPHNNSYVFTQRVTEDVRVLMTATNLADLRRAIELYGAGAALDIYFDDGGSYGRDVLIKRAFESFPDYECYNFYRPDGTVYNVAESDGLKPGESEFREINIHLSSFNLPCNVERLCLYDEIMLINTDVRKITNCLSFIDALDIAVSRFGKSLVTIGDHSIQNKTDDSLKKLENMLPLRYGNDALDPKLYTLVVDASLSMVHANHFEMAKEAARQLFTLMKPDDKVAIIVFSGDVRIALYPETVSELTSSDINSIIDGIEPRQGTVIGKAMYDAYSLIKDLEYSEKQLFLISDGLEGGMTDRNATAVASDLSAAGVKVSVINTNCTDTVALRLLQGVARNGKGDYYFVESVESLKELILSDVADDVTESIIEGRAPVDLVTEIDSALSGVYSLPDIYGYVFAKVKRDATVVELLSTEYAKLSGERVTSTLAAYKSHGNGRVISFTGGLSGEWVAGWEDSADAERFYLNLFDSSIPDERIDYPFDINTEYDGESCRVELLPALLNPDADMLVLVTAPGGEVIQMNPAFNGYGYSLSFMTPSLGRYSLRVSYSYDGISFTADTDICLSYSPEYDAFAYFTPSTLLRALGGVGTVSEDGIPTLVNDPERIGYYVVEFALPFMIAAACLYVIDLIIRKLKWADIRSVFAPVYKERREKK